MQNVTEIVSPAVLECMENNVLPSTGIVGIIVFVILCVVAFLTYTLEDSRVVIIVLSMLPLRALSLDIIAATSESESVSTLVFLGVSEEVSLSAFVLFVSYWAYGLKKQFFEETSSTCCCQSYQSSLFGYAVLGSFVALLPSLFLLDVFQQDPIVGHVAIVGVGIVIFVLVLIQLCNTDTEPKPILNGLTFVDYVLFWFVVIGFSFSTYLLEECYTQPFLSGLLSLFPVDAFILCLRFGSRGNTASDKLQQLYQIVHYLLYVAAVSFTVIIAVANIFCLAFWPN